MPDGVEVEIAYSTLNTSQLLFQSLSEHFGVAHHQFRSELPYVDFR